jgi:hypothetical protein
VSRLDFTSSESFLAHDPTAVEHESLEIHEYIEATYDVLRAGPNGDEIARYVNGAWERNGRRFSDWAVAV